MISKPCRRRAWRYGGLVAACALLFPALLAAQPPTLEGKREPRRDRTEDLPLKTEAEQTRTHDLPYAHHTPGELYVAAFGGYTLGHGFTDVQGTGAVQEQSLSSMGLSNAGMYGGKVGYFMPDQFSWLGVEGEVFDTTPHLKQSPLGPGGHLRVTTLAFNVVARGRFDCGPHSDRRDRRAVSVHTDGPEGFCRVQPYVGIGIGFFFADLTGGLAGGRSNTERSVPGFNGLAGVRMFLTEHLAVFGEYKYQRARFEFEHAVAQGAGIRGDYAVSHVVGGLSVHF